MSKRILALILAAALSVFAFAACDDSVDTESNPVSGDASQAESQPVRDKQPIDLADVVEHKDFTSVYEMIGSKVTIDMVEEDKDTGFAYVTVDGVKYELGMDFLSAAMVYNAPNEDA
ncbi:MAG: hypothetical protein IIX67_02690, partial [Clostridia bacterium]|nr:hypothetical protein [Clostridia bacterium]